MYFKQQQGGGLFNFMAGSIATLGAIAAVLFTLNQNNARDFQQPKMVNNPVSSEPAVLTPKPDVAASTTVANVETAASMVQPIPPVAANTQNTTADNEPIMVQAASDSTTTPRVAQPSINNNKATTTPSKPRETTVVQNDPVLGEAIPEPAKPAAPRKQPARVAVDNIEPTGEQILEAGNLQKARQLARREAERKAQQTSNKPTATTEPNKPKGRTVIQAGAYNSRAAAEEQRTKLALSGVQTKIVPVQSNGKTLYRVQTSSMDSSRAAQVQQKLKNNGVDTITRPQ
ncbi:SPOR domain-containing protein [Kingella kingae]|uniref:SPOR domain-containing protein n=1 Tax=Kingella kingae TaxID=504 RepID=UPI0025513C8E|nr:SPOR domain-containing protein [Kingella kingae]MDK4611674.1 SPOR domain-containing protein [Kingella kingae]